MSEKSMHITLDIVVLKAAPHDGDPRNNFIMYAPTLRVYGIGSTEEDAEKDLDASVDLFFRIYNDPRRMHNKLISLGWEPYDNHLEPPPNFDIPANLVRNKDARIASKKLPKKYALAAQ